MTGKTAHIHTRIDAAVKEEFHRFLLKKHGVVKHVYGAEIGLALEAYLAEHSEKYKNTDAALRPRGDTSTRLRSILSGLKTQEKYPILPHKQLDRVIRDLCKYRDRRTVLKYRGLILRHSKEVRLPGEIFPKYDISGFEKYVSQLLRESV